MEADLKALALCHFLPLVRCNYGTGYGILEGPDRNS